MMRGADTPEELETLFEDALLTGDREGLRALLDEACVVADDDGREARGPGEVERLAGAWRAAGRSCVAGAGDVLQAGDTALIVSAGGLHVARCDGGGRWRLAISRIEHAATTERRRG
jgi:hypothetical protein